MRELLSLAERVAGSDSSLLVVGETGVGKEWLARWVHARSPRSAGPFVAVNCAALPGELVESELFGHERGAFTGAHRARRGQFELAHQDREVRPVGGERSIPVDVRIVAATNREPEAAVRSKQLREDLFYRLSVVTLEVPPLRDRSEDVPALAKEYLGELRLRLGRPEVREVSAPVLRAFQAYAWPGNVRELINVLERAVLLSRGPALTLEDIPMAISGAAVGREGGSADGGRPRPGWDRFWENSFDLPLGEARAAVVDEYEREYLRRLLEETGGRVGESARRAGVDERTLYNKMRRYGLDKERFRERVR
jgi:transcriptional regulator with GAF, ATPase, and Fis domain